MRTTLTIIFALIICDLFSQSIVKGVVTDTLGFELRGAQIVEIKTKNSVHTDINGSFVIKTLQDTTQLLISHIGFLDERIIIQSDTILKIILHDEIITLEDMGLYNTKWLTFGLNYDFVSSYYGFLLSNGYNERPLIHFEDYFEKFIFKIYGTTDFARDYSIGTDLGIKYPMRYISVIGLGVSQFDYPQCNYFHREINASAETFVNKLDFALSLKIAYQTLNDDENLGIGFGIRKVILNRKLYSGASIGYYSDYFTYSVYLQGFAYKNKIGLRLDYERIADYEFFNLGLNFTFNRQNKKSAKAL